MNREKEAMITKDKESIVKLQQLQLTKENLERQRLETLKDKMQAKMKSGIAEKVLEQKVTDL